jgi:hypothetical protein
VAGNEDTEPEAVPPGELWDDPEQAEQTTAKTPTAAASVPFLIVIAPVSPD